MSDLKNEIKAALLELLQDLMVPKGAMAGATGFGPIPGDDRVQIQGKEGQKIAWYRLDSEKERHYVEEPAFTGKVVGINTRDASGDRSNARKIDLTMRDSGGHTVTFVLGLKSSLDKPETTVGSKSLLAALASCPDNDRQITIIPRLGDKNAAVVLMSVLVDGVSVSSGDPSEEESAENLRIAMATFGGTHIPLRDAEAAQAQPQRSAAPAPSAKPVAAAAPAKGGADVKSQWMDMKFYLGKDAAVVAETRELIVAWCRDQYMIDNPLNIPASGQAMALYDCKKHLDKYAAPAAVVPDEDWSDDIPF